jgi:phosphoribosylformylglycinamidine (FGAM) synthase-like enzyme
MSAEIREDILEQFWSDYCRYKGERDTRFALLNLLKKFRTTLENSSKTANSIDNDLVLDKIIQSAKEEDFIEFAEVVSFAKSHLD